MEKLYIEQGQDLMDMAIAVYGGVEYVFQILEDNPSLVDVNSNLVPGDFIWIQPSLVVNDVNKYYSKNRISVASGNKAVELNFDPNGFNSGFEGGID